MAFTNNRVDFFERESYTEKLHAFALAKGLENCVPNGLELSGNILSNGYFANGGALGQLGNEGETHTITSNYTGFIVVKTTFNGVNSESEIVESSTFLSTPLSDKGAIKHFTIYELANGAVVNDYRNRRYIKSIEIISQGDDTFTIKINDQESNEFNVSVLQNAWTKSESDNRYERTVDVIRAGYTNADFSSFTQFAEVIAFLKDDNFEGYGASVITGTFSATLLPSVHTLINNLLDLIFNQTIGSMTIRLEENGKNLSGGAHLIVSENNGGSFYITYDNYGPNYLTEDVDAFQADTNYYGNIYSNLVGENVRAVNMAVNGKLFSTDKTEVPVSQGFKFDGLTAGTRILTYDLPSTTDANYAKDLILLDTKYLTGVNRDILRFNNDVDSSSGRFIALRSTLSTGTAFMGINAYDGGQAAFDIGVGSSFAYSTRELNAKIEMQQQVVATNERLDQMQMLKTESAELRDSKMLLAKLQLELETTKRKDSKLILEIDIEQMEEALVRLNAILETKIPKIEEESNVDVGDLISKIKTDLEIKKQKLQELEE